MRTVTVVQPSAIANERAAIHISRQELADEADLKGGPQHLGKIERGTVTPGLKTLEALTSALVRLALARSRS